MEKVNTSINKVTAIYSILMGVSMLGMWWMLYLTKQIPELATEPSRIILHMVAEAITAVALIIGGSGLLRLKKWGFDVYLLATGGLIYTLIQSPGYYLEQGIWGYVIMFAIFLLITLGLLSKMLRNHS